MGPQATVYVNGVIPEPSARQGWLDNLRRDYPGAASASLLSEQSSSFGTIHERRYEVHLLWPTIGSPDAPTAEQLENFFDVVAPSYRHRNERFLRPHLGDSGQAPPLPLMSWWLLLYSFSMLARYQPRKWMELLDVDKSEIAVGLQFSLELAMTIVPHLILEALDRQPRFLPKPMSLY